MNALAHGKRWLVMGARRKLIMWFAIILVCAGMLALVHWVDYHVKGKSPIWGNNPRCIEDIVVGYCSKLDTTNMPWQATLAVWIDKAFSPLTIAAVIGGAAMILLGAVVGVILLATISGREAS